MKKQLALLISMLLIMSATLTLITSVARSLSAPPSVQTVTATPLMSEATDWRPNWTKMDVGTSPPGAQFHVMAYNSKSDRVIFLGGATWRDGIPMRNDETWAYDFNRDRWTNMNPATKPPSLVQRAMAYDNESNRVILFGGWTGYGGLPGLSGETWAYDFDNNTWTKMSPYPRPSGRWGHATAYDAESDRVVLFGGDTSSSGFGQNDETWAYDFDSNTWTNMNPATKPSGRWGHATAYDAESDRVILFGGYTKAGLNNETWTYDFDTNTWTNVTPVLSPSGTAETALAYDSESDRIILFGGWWVGDNTWAYDFNNNMWTNVTPATGPSARSRHALAYDSGSDRVILFGGAKSRNGGIILNDETWAYDFNNNTWTEMNPYRSPPVRDGHTMAHDAESDRAILFGGYPLSNDTWAYDFNSDTWTKMEPATGPSARSWHATAYDRKSDRVILFGGDTSGSGERNDETWAYDFNNNMWTNVTPATGPSARSRHALAYDSGSDRVILFGGWTEAGGNNETWAYDFNTNTWANVTSAVNPSARSGHTMAYDSESDRVILFGGPDDETWVYDFDNNTWTNMKPAVKPSARFYHAMVYDAESDRVVLFGGYYNKDDTWSYNFNTNTWVDLTPAISPSGRHDHALAYDSGSDRVILFGGSSGGDQTWSYQPPPVTPPSTPQNLQATAGNGLVNLTWQVPWDDGGSPIANYRIYRGTASGDLSFLVEVGNVLEYTDTGLTNGQRYYYKVAAVNSIDEGPPSNETSATPVTVPSAPQDLDAMAGNGRVALTWIPALDDGGSSITGYRMYRGTTSGDLSFLAEVGNVLEYTDAGLTNGVTYYYQVSAVNAVGEGPRSSEISSTPTATVPSWPQNLHAMASNGQVALTWIPPLDDGGSPIAGYRIYRGMWSGMETFLVEVGNITIYTDTGLTNGQTYYYRVSALNGVGEGAQSSEVSATPSATVASAPRNLQATAGDGYVDITWDAPSSDGGSPITSYEIYRGTTSGGETWYWSVSDALSWRDPWVTNGVTYYYQVSAWNNKGEGPRSNEALATPSAPATADTTKPTITINSPADGTTLTSASVTVSGTASDDVAVDKVEISTDGADWILATGTTSWSSTLTIAEGSNTIYARATDTSGNTATVSITVTVEAVPPDTEPQDTELLPTNLIVTAIVVAVVAAGTAAILIWRRSGRARGKNNLKESKVQVRLLLFSTP